MSMNVEGLKGTIQKRGKNSWRVQISLGRNERGKYTTKRETVRGQKQDAIDLLTRWNAELLDGSLTETTKGTVKDHYDLWIKFIRTYREPNTHRFYRERWEKDILPEIGNKRLKDITVSQLQNVLSKHPTKDRHNKRALSALYGWLVKQKIIRENPCSSLETMAKPSKKSEDDVWTIDQVRSVYSVLEYKNLYDIMIPLGVDCGLRLQEILALKWDKLDDGLLTIDEAVKHRDPDSYIIGSPKTIESHRIVYCTKYLLESLETHRENQSARIDKNRAYSDHDLIVADSNGKVPCYKYLNRYLQRVCMKAKVPEISCKDLRSTNISLLSDLGVPLDVIQRQAGHAIGSDVTRKHYLRVYGQSVKDASEMLHDKIHLPNFTQETR